MEGFYQLKPYFLKTSSRKSFRFISSYLSEKESFFVWCVINVCKQNSFKQLSNDITLYALNTKKSIEVKKTPGPTLLVNGSNFAPMVCLLLKPWRLKPFLL